MPQTYSTELQEEAAKNGVQINQTAYVDPADPDVYVGPSSGPPAPEGKSAGTTRKASQVYVDLYRMDPDRLRQLQEKFYAAGLYGSAERDEIPWGETDDDTFNLWKDFVDQAARKTFVGRTDTPFDVIDSYVASTSRKGQKGPKRAPLTITLDHPDDLGKVYEAIASATIGRKPKPEETARFVANFQQAQRAAQTSAYGIGETGGTSVDAPDPRVAAERQLKAENPAEAENYGLFNTYEKALDFLTAPPL